GSIHTHPKGTYSIFSWLDLRALKNTYSEVNEDFSEDVFLIALAPNNITYALKVNNIQMLINKLDSDWNSARGNTDEDKEDFLERITADKYKKSSSLEQAFLDLYGSYGTSFYKATDANLTNWKQLELDEDNNETVKEIPCN